MHGYVFTMQYPCGWVSPFGHRRINACCQLPDAFRRLPRPSSPLTAKASTVCAYSLDHITPSRLRVIRRREHQRLITSNKGARAPRLSLYDTSWTFVSKRSLLPDCQRTRTWLQRQARFRSLCAQSHSELVGLGGLEPPASPLSGVRSNHLSYRPKKSSQVRVVEPVGIEPTTPCLQSRCSPS